MMNDHVKTHTIHCKGEVKETVTLEIYPTTDNTITHNVQFEKGSKVIIFVVAVKD